MICVDHRKLEIDWTNCVGFASDNCNTLIGARNMGLSRVHERQPHVYSLGCICHLAGLCVKAGMEQWSLPVDDLLIDEWFHFVHSNTISSTICCPHLYWFNKFNYAEIICCTKRFIHVCVEFLVPRGTKSRKLVKIKHVPVITFGLAICCQIATITTLHEAIYSCMCGMSIFSAKRRKLFQEFQEFANVEEFEILKHCQTRWLSLLRVIERVLD